ncbi:MAG: thiazole synthase [Pyrinomonadaceae bacterium MAG19_C2-C3]|nr:thiazole synthase [Pyrinomonadaceae bacterium MAG19_C2-C3]
MSAAIAEHATIHTSTHAENYRIGAHTFTSRLIIGTGKYRSHEEMQRAHRASGAEMVTVAVRRVPLDRSTKSFLDYLDPAMKILPNTAGCYTAEDAIRTARLAREALDTDLIKLEVIGDQTTLFPDNEGTLEAARILVKEGFVVLPYFSDDLIMAKKLLDCGCAAVMPLAAPIGSGLGICNPANIRIMREQLPDALIIVDAGVGTASDAAIAMELGADAVLMNTAIAEAGDAEKMAHAMNFGIKAGRLAYEAGRMPRRLYASASSPLHGVIK